MAPDRTATGPNRAGRALKARAAAHARLVAIVTGNPDLPAAADIARAIGAWESAE